MRLNVLLLTELQKLFVDQGILPDESEEGGSGDKTSIIEGSDVKSLPVPEKKRMSFRWFFPFFYWTN